MTKLFEIIKNTIMLFLNEPILIVLLIMCVILKLIYPKVRGFFGEFWINVELKKLPKEYIILKDIMIKTSNKTHQIDHLVISKYGIFVIETKNYFGLIKGNEYDEKWTQYLGKNKYKFLNPIRQNYGHIVALKEVLNMDINNFISIICFSNQAKLSIKNATKVTQIDYLIDEILSYTKIIIKDNINDIANKIDSLNIIEVKEKREHIKSIKKNISSTRKKEQQNICPKCNSNLVRRNGKYGEFLGCSNYPKCKYTKEVR